MSTNMNGFSTLNRWFRKKNKEKNISSGKLSASTTNLSGDLSPNNIIETSQFEYNRITPLPVATSNAPFEQTFRITVLLPKDQLYVVRLGARVSLNKLMNLVCENKLLDSEKYEFCNPADPSQVYSCSLTIGTVGLTEIRLCPKSDSCSIAGNNDEVIKFHRMHEMRNSLSPEYISHNSKHIATTSSPYSSNNSLNSIDSTDTNYKSSSTVIGSTVPILTNVKMVPPPRRKRVAPKPPTQKIIPEKSNNMRDHNKNPVYSDPVNNYVDQIKEQSIPIESSKEKAMQRKEYFTSTPNLSQISVISDLMDCNGNTEIKNKYTDEEIVENLKIGNRGIEVQKKNNLHSQSTQNLNNIEKIMSSCLPEPSPRKKLIQTKKKPSAPAPPLAASIYTEDTVSTSSTILYNDLTSHEELLIGKDVISEDSLPKPTLRSTTTISTSDYTAKSSSTEKLPTEITQINPKPIPRQTAINHEQQQNNVTTVLLNRTPIPELCPLSSETNDSHTLFINVHNTNTYQDEDNFSKQADSGIGDALPSPLPDSLPFQCSTNDFKSTFESTSSDDDDIIKVYNFKLGQTSVKAINDAKTIKDLKMVSANVDTNNTISPECPIYKTSDGKPNSVETTENDSFNWNISIPISPPPNFADNMKTCDKLDKIPDIPITPKIKERPVLNFNSVDIDNSYDALKTKETTDDVLDKNVDIKYNFGHRSKSPSPISPLTELVNELSVILHENRTDGSNKENKDNSPLSPSKSMNLSNSEIVLSEEADRKCITAPYFDSVDEYINNNNELSNNLLNETTLVTRAKSRELHRTEISLNINQMHGLKKYNEPETDNRCNRRRSSSELSIGGSPSLQSPEVIKSILNSRKNSLEAHIEIKSSGYFIQKQDNHETTPKPKNIAVEKEDNSIELSDGEDKRKIPTIYRNSGPPTINFATWNERPKTKVAIKNEGDYIIGVKNMSKNNEEHNITTKPKNHTIPRNYKSVTPVESVNVQHTDSTASISLEKSIINRMGIPTDKEFKIPIAVKPLKDVIIENTSKANKSTPTKEQSVLTTVTLNGTQQPVFKRNLTSDPTTTFLRDGATNRFSLPSDLNLKLSLPRSSSIKQLSSEKSTKHTNEVNTLTPFGQSNLRKTGLKEKILAEDTKNEKNNVFVNMESKPVVETKMEEILVDCVELDSTNNKLTNKQTRLNTSNSQNNIEIIQNGKFESKLQKTKDINIKGHQVNNTFAPIPPPPMPIFLNSVALKPKAKNLKVSSNTPTTEDPRTQLLEAIRNFKRDELKRT